MEKLDLTTPNFTDENIQKLECLFPNCVSEDGNGKTIDFDLLKQELSGNIIEGNKERYQLTWPGKAQSLLTANTPINKTLRPVREQSKDFDNTENLYIEGDNLEVLKLLQETYLGKVKMIYIDPPYNTGNDFVYKDNFTKDKAEYDEESGNIDDEGGRLISNPDSNGRYHSDWLSMMYPRLKLARNLLKDDGVIFISIDDNEVHNLRKVCDEIFGVSNFLGSAGRVTKKSNNKGDFWAPNLDYVLTYAKTSKSTVKFFGGVNYEAYNLVETESDRKGEKYQLVRLYMSSLQNRNPEQRFFITCPDGSKIIPPGSTLPPERPNLGDGIWRWTRSKIENELDKIVIKSVKSSNLITEEGKPAKWNVFTKTYLSDVIANASAKPNSLIEGHINQIGSHEINSLEIPFDFSKPSTLVKYLTEISRSDDNAIILDFFSGSATTAHAVMQLNTEDNGNRKFIMAQIPEATDEKSEAHKAGYKTITEIGKERIRRAGEKIKEDNADKEGIDDLDIGFRVLKVDSSNMKDVYFSPCDTRQGDMLDLASNIKDDRADEDLLFMVLLDWGIDLSVKIKRKEVAGKTVYFADDNFLAACFEENLDEDFVKALAGEKPLKVVLRDSGFASSSVKINVEQIFKQADIEIKVI